MNETIKEIVQNIGGHMLWENKGPDYGLLTPGEGYSRSRNNQNG